MTIQWPDALKLGAVTVLTGTDGGSYPHGNSVLVQGRTRSLLIDPSLCTMTTWRAWRASPTPPFTPTRPMYEDSTPSTKC